MASATPGKPSLITVLSVLSCHRQGRKRLRDASCGASPTGSSELDPNRRDSVVGGDEVELERPPILQNPVGDRDGVTRKHGQACVGPTGVDLKELIQLRKDNEGSNVSGTST
jgi:hypothetical protein